MVAKDGAGVYWVASHSFTHSFVIHFLGPPVLGNARDPEMSQS